MALVNPFGKIGLEATLQKIAQYLQQIASNIGMMYPDTGGNMRTVITSGTVTTVTTVTTLTNQTQQSGYFTNYDQYAQIQMCANGIRDRIQIS